ncbi:hypothetical protein YDYSY3_39340 [Paenibacillus chitinolyticus]|uniref:hypothetical protein n=1 Tax=Paenibacillus chitinolyticus TaxID=79263 RepID=UPI0026E4FBBE|nr:hypothetical protein [Paenibacillus chitinolyticus]GKS12934.1 hypothetical protein YDYSY3_39340 [Paenibacillus chitinolyticus]
MEQHASLLKLSSNEIYTLFVSLLTREKSLFRSQNDEWSDLLNKMWNHVIDSDKLYSLCNINSRRLLDEWKVQYFDDLKRLDILQEPEIKKRYNEIFYSARQIIKMAEKFNVDQEVIDEFTSDKNNETEYWYGCFPFLLEREENSIEYSQVRIFLEEEIALLEYRKYGVTNDSLQIIDAKRRLVEYDEIESLLKSDFKWTIRPKSGMLFDLKKALDGDFTSYDL